MKIVKYPDWLINFIGDAYHEVKNKSQVTIVPCENGMVLLIGKHELRGKVTCRYNVILMDGKKRLSAVQLNEIGRTRDGRLICEPHTFTVKHARGNGYAEQIYCWLLDNNIVLRSCDHQTLASHQMWMKLSWLYNIQFYDEKKRKYCALAQIDNKHVVLELSK